MTGEHDSTTGDARPRRGVRLREAIVVVLLALSARASVLVVMRTNLQADPDAYVAIARHLRQQGDFARGGRLTAYRPPLYPLLLAAIGGDDSNWGPLRIAVLHAVLGAATVLLVFLMAADQGGRKTAWIAAGLVAIDPLLLQQSTLVMTETLAVLLAAATLYVFQRTEPQSQTALANLARGACLGLAILCRPTFLVWCGLLTLPSLGRRPRPLKGLAVMLVAAGVLLLPWTLRNWRHLGKPIFTTTHGGYTLWLANNPGFYDYLRQRDRPPQWDSAQLDQVHLARLRELDFDEVRTDRFCYAQAWKTIQQRPGDFLWSIGVRVGRLWRLAPHAATRQESWPAKAARYAVGLWYAALFLLAARGYWLRPDLRAGPPHATGLWLAISLTIVHAFFWSNLRMRAPVTPWIALWASVGKQTKDQPSP